MANPDNTTVMAFQLPRRKWKPIDNAAPTDGQVPTYNAATDEVEWATPPGAGGTGEVNTASNIGVGGIGFFDAKVGVDLRFRNLDIGSGGLSAKLSLSHNDPDNEVELTLAAIALDDLSDVAVAAAPTASILTKDGGNWVDALLVNGSGGSVDIYQGYDAALDQHRFRQPKAGTNITITDVTADTFTINAAVSGSTFDDLSDVDVTGAPDGSIPTQDGGTWVDATFANVGGGAALYKSYNAAGDTHDIRTLIQGANITLTEGTNTVTVAVDTGVLLTDGSRPLTADWDAGDFDITADNFIASSVSDTLHGEFQFRRARAGPAAVQDGDALGIIQSAGHDGATFQDGAAIRFEAGGTWSGINRASRIEFYTIADGATAQTLWLTVHENGQVESHQSFLAPFIVNSSAKVSGLNVDFLDDLSSEAFVQSLTDGGGPGTTLINDGNPLPDGIVKLKTISAGTNVTLGGDATDIVVNASVGALDDLTDVSVSGAADGTVLTKDGAAWIDAALFSLDISFPVYKQYAAASDRHEFRGLSAGSNISLTLNANDIGVGFTGSLDHGSQLTGLLDDDHTQYVHNSVARTISAIHTFSGGTPFNVSGGGLVTNLNADRIDDLHASSFAQSISSAGGTQSLINDSTTPTWALKGISNGTNIAWTDNTTHLVASVSPQGPGSGLDADTVDGVQESAFVLASGTRALTGNWDAGNFEIQAAKFNAVRQNTSAELTSTGYGNNGVWTGLLKLRKARGTQSVPTAIKSGDFLGVITADGYETGFATGARIDFNATELWNGSGHGTKITVATTPNASTVTTARLVIDHDGSADFQNNPVTAGRFVSEVATGTQPYACTSTTINTNLNADTVDSRHRAYFQKSVTQRRQIPLFASGPGVLIGQFTSNGQAYDELDTNEYEAWSFVVPEEIQGSDGSITLTFNFAFMRPVSQGTISPDGTVTFSFDAAKTSDGNAPAPISISNHVETIPDSEAGEILHEVDISVSGLTRGQRVTVKVTYDSNTNLTDANKKIWVTPEAVIEYTPQDGDD